MKVLFVCKGNNCRSQIAEAVYNRLTNSNDANSAGTNAEVNNETLGQWRTRQGRSHTLELMSADGYNLEDKKVTQLTKDMPAKYDLVVSMAAKSLAPTWLSSSPNYVYWKIIDPKGRGLAFTRRAKEKIEQKVRELVESGR
jgi:protein-tyrosine-phosphatase